MDATIRRNIMLKQTVCLPCPFSSLVRVLSIAAVALVLITAEVYRQIFEDMMKKLHTK